MVEPPLLVLAQEVALDQTFSLIVASSKMEELEFYALQMSEVFL